MTPDTVGFLAGMALGGVLTLAASVTGSVLTSRQRDNMDRLHRERIERIRAHGKGKNDGQTAR